MADTESPLKSSERLGIEPGTTRRAFLQAVAVTAATTSLLRGSGTSVHGQADSQVPWYRKTFRWGQTNINELDPTRYDIAWWRRHWKATSTQGLVINAGGIVAYYPSKLPYHYRAQYLANRDLYGELVRAAHEDGLVVLARMDSNRAHEDFYQAHPDWFAVDVEGQPYKAGELYISCIDGPYYDRYLPQVLGEIIAWERPEGFTDNSWSGLGRNQICHCEYSRERFREATGLDLPSKKDWDDDAYRQWIEWSYARRVQVWELNNQTTKKAGGSDCLWLGMLGGDLISQGQSFRDIRKICQISEMVMLDDQSRSIDIGFHENAEIGKRLHGLLGWDKIIPESMATYQRSPTFRKASAPAPEARLWMYSGFAGGIQPWWHHVGAYQWDRRQFQTEVPVYQWYAKHQEFLVNRQPVATVGVVYSQRNADFYGRDQAREQVARPYYGMIQALVQRRIPYIPIHIDDVDQYGSALSVLVLPNLAALTELQCQAIRRFVERGGNLLATGETSLYDEWGKKKSEFSLADLFKVRFSGNYHGSTGRAESWENIDHSYLRLLPAVGRDVYGPAAGTEPEISPTRHPVLKGFEDTDIIAFGGLVPEVRPEDGALVPATLIPTFPAYPPETSWMREPETSIPAVVLSQTERSRIAYVPSDLDRRLNRDNLPDHARFLGNLLEWAAQGSVPLKVEGKGLIDCNLYRQDRKLILHLVNLNNGTWRSPVHELIPIGPLNVEVKSPEPVGEGQVRCLVSGVSLQTSLREGWLRFQIDLLRDHEVVVIG